MKGNFWNKPIETMSADALASLQSERLRALTKRVYNNVPHYAEKMKAAGLLAGDIKGVDDLKKLPFTTKEDLRDTYPFGMFAVPMDDIVRIHASSGTTGKQTVVGYTANDIDSWAECAARCFVMAGADTGSRVQVCYGYGLFTGGLGMHYGAEKLGAVAIPASTGNTQRQITMLKDFGTTHLCCTPSYALYIAETLAEAGVSKSELKLTAGIFGAEPWTEEMRAQIEQMLGVKAFDIYGLSEIMGPSVSQECECQSGLHVWEDMYIVETVDPATGETVEAGQPGELVFTTLTKEGFPLIRYRTRDISVLSAGACACGRSHIRMSKPSGRTDDMLIIRGVNVFPSQIESVLLTVGEASPHYRIIVERIDNLDVMTVEIEVSDALFSDRVKGLENSAREIKMKIGSLLGVSCGVRMVEPGTIARSEGKAKRVIDKRRQG